MPQNAGRRRRRRGVRWDRAAIMIILLLAVLGGAAMGLKACMSSQPAPPAPERSEPSLPPEASSSEEEPEALTAFAPGEVTVEGEYPDWPDFEFPPGGDYRLILVNKDNVLGGEMPGLEDKLAGIGDFQVHEGVLPHLQRMMDDAKAAGLPLAIVSAYRPLSRSAILYEKKTQEYLSAGYGAEEAAVEAAKWVAPPGTSEHATGLSLDIVSGDYYTKMSDLEQEFENFPEAIWLREHCAEYGFILRFPKNKEDITKVYYEPWHFRYVGQEAAREIMDNGLTLEEYLSKS